MDRLAELNHGAKVVLGSAIALLIVSFFHWFTYGPFGENMWHGIGVIAGLLVIALIAWQAVRLANINVEIGVTPAMITAVLAVLTFVFVLIRFIDKPGSGPVSDVIDRSIWAWLGLILAIVLVAGAWANMKLAGESLTDMKDRVAAMGKGGTGGGAEAPAAPSGPGGDAASTGCTASAGRACYAARLGREQHLEIAARERGLSRAPLDR